MNQCRRDRSCDVTTVNREAVLLAARSWRPGPSCRSQPAQSRFVGIDSERGAKIKRHRFSGEHFRSASPLSKEAATWLHDDGLTSVVADRISILRPLSGDMRRTFADWPAVSTINEKTRTDLRRRIEGLDALSTCNHCGQPTEFDLRGLYFLATCRVCRTEWGVYVSAGKRLARFGVIGEKSPIFASYGTWGLDIPRCERSVARQT